jgi:hypothetical protein
MGEALGHGAWPTSFADQNVIVSGDHGDFYRLFSGGCGGFLVGGVC